MNVKLKVFLNSLQSDDEFFISVTTAEKMIYFGYNDNLPAEFDNMIVKTVYLDFASQALGIYVE